MERKVRRRGLGSSRKVRRRPRLIEPPRIEPASLPSEDRRPLEADWIRTGGASPPPAPPRVPPGSPRSRDADRVQPAHEPARPHGPRRIADDARNADRFDAVV